MFAQSVSPDLESGNWLPLMLNNVSNLTCFAGKKFVVAEHLPSVTFNSGLLQAILLNSMLISFVR